MLQRGWGREGGRKGIRNAVSGGEKKKEKDLHVQEETSPVKFRYRRSAPQHSAELGRIFTFKFNDRTTALSGALESPALRGGFNCGGGFDACCEKTSLGIMGTKVRRV